MKQLTELLLASGSPRRSELLHQIGLRFEVVRTDIDERVLPGEMPSDYVCRLAKAKAQAGQEQSGRPWPSLGADTVVLLGGKILGKPANRIEAAKMLRLMSNREHEVLSAVALAPVSGSPGVLLNTTRVRFASFPEAFIENYCASDEPLDKAGAYAIQGEAGMYVSRIEGSYTGVMGLPLYETGKLLRAAGVTV